MACVAACSDRGTTNPVNQDACCVLTANTPLGEVAMGVVCDGVGGLALGELASATVANSFVRWFEGELPTLMAGMERLGAFSFGLVEAAWRARLDSLNAIIQAHGAQAGSLGTTFTGFVTCGGHYLAAHVGDCRLYQLGDAGLTQVTEDQTLLAHKLASGELTPEEAETFPQRHVIMQAIGTERVLKPAFYHGDVADDELLVVCCDGAYLKAADGRLAHAFEEARPWSDVSLGRACHQVIDYDISQGETDNLTIVCFSPMMPLETVQDVLPTTVAQPDATPTTVAKTAFPACDQDAIKTRVVGPDISQASTSGTSAEPKDPDDTPTVLVRGGDA